MGMLWLERGRKVFGFQTVGGWTRFAYQPVGNEAEVLTRRGKRCREPNKLYGKKECEPNKFGGNPTGR